MKKINFSSALRVMYLGGIVKREGWDDKYIFVKYTENKMPIPFSYTVFKQFESNQTSQDFERSIFCSTTYNNDIFVYQPSMSDIMAVDWLVVDDKKEIISRLDQDIKILDNMRSVSRACLWQFDTSKKSKLGLTIAEYTKALNESLILANEIREDFKKYEFICVNKSIVSSKFIEVVFLKDFFVHTVIVQPTYNIIEGYLHITNVHVEDDISVYEDGKTLNIYDERLIKFLLHEADLESFMNDNIQNFIYEDEDRKIDYYDDKQD
jgi:hypothetical protein